MAAQAEKEIDWAAIDAMTDADIARQIAENPDAAPLLNRAQTAAGLVRYVRGQLCQRRRPLIRHRLCEERSDVAIH